MIHQQPDNRSLKERLDDVEGMNRAVQGAVREALRRHMLLGESVVGIDESGDGRGVRVFTPEEIRKILDAA